MSDPRSPRTLVDDSRRNVLRLAGLAAAVGALGGLIKTTTASDDEAQAMNSAATGTNPAWNLPGDQPLPKVVKTEEEWQRLLTKDQFYVSRKKGTERAFTGATWDNHEKGVYRCVACGLELFSSETKYDSGTGWPSFWKPIAPDRVGTEVDKSFFSIRTEVHCARCDGHLGHVFDDGPPPTGLRYCMNSSAVVF